MDDKGSTRKTGKDSDAPPSLPARGQTNPPPKDVRAENGGFETISDYNHFLPRLIDEQAKAIGASKDFAKVAGKLAADHDSRAAEYTAQAASIGKSATDLGSADGGSQIHGSVPAFGAPAQAGAGDGGGAPIRSGKPAGPAAVAAREEEREPSHVAPGWSDDNASLAAPRQAVAAQPGRSAAGQPPRSSVSRPGDPGSAARDHSRLLDASAASAGRSPASGSGAKSDLRSQLEKALARAASNGGEPAASNGASAVASLLGGGGSAFGGGAGAPAAAGGEGKSFHLSGTETDAEVRRLQEGDSTRSSGDILGAESEGLFQRVSSAYRRIENRVARLSASR